MRLRRRDGRCATSQRPARNTCEGALTISIQRWRMSDEQPMAATIRSEPSREIVKLTELPERPNGWTKHLAVHYNYGSGSYILNSLESAESTRQAGFAQVWFLVCVFVSLCLSALNFSEAAVLHDENSQHSRSLFYSFLIFVQDEAAQIEVYFGGPVAAF